MENKEMKKPIPVELEDDALDTVSGGSSVNLEYYCPDCKVYFSMTMSGCPLCGKATAITGNRFGQ